MEEIKPSKEYSIITLIIPHNRIPILKPLKITRRDNKYGVIYEEDFYPIDYTKILLLQKRRWFLRKKTIHFIILCSEYEPDIIHSLSKEQWLNKIQKNIK